VVEAMILAIDQGTTGSTCLVFDGDGEVKGRAYAEFTQHFPEPGLVEHEPDEIWEVTRAVAGRALDEAAIDGRNLDAIGITNQRETVVAWDPRTGRPVHRALVWQDRRGAARCDQLRSEGLGEVVESTTGLLLDPYFSATKIEWLIENVPETAGAVFGTIDSWLIQRLCGEHVTDPSNASRTMLFDIESLEWSDELCSIFGVDTAALPDVRDSAGIFGTTTEFGGEVPVAGVAGDQQAALFGQACFLPGMTKNTYGTGSFVLQNAGDAIPRGKGETLSTIAWGIDGKASYASEASIFVTGSAVQWLRDGLGIIGEASETEGLASSLDSNDGVYFVPALTGLGSPWWDPYARGTITGLTRGTGRAQIARATLEAIAYQTADAVDAQQRASGRGLEALRVDGGAVANDWLMQFQADVLGVPVMAPATIETTAKGAADLAALGIGATTIERLGQGWTAKREWHPAISRDEAESLLEGWHAAVGRSRGQAGP
jgi:glycerol kinase